jgi:hypothetical protein
MSISAGGWDFTDALRGRGHDELKNVWATDETIKKGAMILLHTPISHLSLKKWFCCCLHLEDEGGLGTDMSTMASVRRHSLIKYFITKQQIGNTVLLTLRSCHLLVLFSDTTVAAVPDLVRGLTNQPCTVSE